MFSNEAAAIVFTILVSRGKKALWHFLLFVSLREKTACHVALSLLHSSSGTFFLGIISGLSHHIFIRPGIKNIRVFAAVFPIFFSDPLHNPHSHQKLSPHPQCSLCPLLILLPKSFFLIFAPLLDKHFFILRCHNNTRD